MNVKEYQELALRTESHLDNVTGDLPLLKHTLELFQKTTVILDALKKSIYYGDNSALDSLSDSLMVGELLDSAKVTSEFLRDVDHNYDIEVDYRVLHGILGICTESGELAEPLIDKLVSNKEFDSVNIHEEMHDISWYMAILHSTLGLNWEDGLENNINKLKVRFPEKFTTDKAANRNLSAERTELEKSNG